ncbi:TonB-dependent siderophore receptor [Sinorhizobium sp. CB9]
MGAFTVDNQLQAEFDTAAIAHTLLLGLDYQHVDSDVRIGYGTAPTVDVFDPVYKLTIVPPTLTQDIDQTRDQIGIYVQDQLKWDRLVVSLGGRYDWASSETTTRSLTSSAPASTVKQDDGAFTGRIGAIYLFDNGIAPYASYSTSFEPLAGVTIEGNPFEPTTAEQFEIGVRYQPPGSESLVSLAAFDITQENLRTAVTDLPGQYRQLGEVRSRGFEAEAKLNLSAGFNVIGSYTYQDVETVKDTPSTAGGTSLEGKVPYNVPRQMGSIWLDYEVQTGPLEGLGLGVGVRYVGSSWADSTNTTKVPSYTLVDLGLRYDFGKKSPDLDGLHLDLNLKNLFDEEYVSGCAGRLTSCYWGNGRTALATLTYRW